MATDLTTPGGTKRGIDTVIVGISTNHRVETAVRDAADMGHIIKQWSPNT